MRYLAADSSGNGAFVTLMWFAIIGAAIYFVMIRPQQKQKRRITEMQSAMGVGDEVVTIGGLYGTIHSVDDETVLLEIAPSVVTRYARAAISRVVTSADELDDDVEESTADDDDAVEGTSDKVNITKSDNSG